MIGYGTAIPQLTQEEALRAVPVRLVDSEVTNIGDGSGMLNVTQHQSLNSSRWGRLFFGQANESTKAIELDTIGMFVWAAIDGRTSVEQITRRLASRYDLKLREATVPTLAFLQTLLRQGLIDVPIEMEPRKVG